MKRLELILILLLITGITLNLLLISGGGVLTVLSTMSLSLFYAMTGAVLFNEITLKTLFKSKDAFQNISNRKIVGAALTGIALSVLITGILFKVMSWPGASPNIYTGLVTSGVILVISVIMYFKKQERFYLGVLKRVVLYCLIGLLLALIPRVNWMEAIHGKKHPEYIKAYKEYLANPSDDNLWQKVLEEENKIRDAK